MKKISEHVKIYLAQKESLFSILGRVSIGLITFFFPIVTFLDNYLLLFFYKWLFIFIFIYHLIYTWNSLPKTEVGIDAIVLLLLSITFIYSEQDDSLYFLVFVFIAIHVSYGLYSILSDYLLSDLDELFFFNHQAFFYITFNFFSFYLPWFIAFEY